MPRYPGAEDKYVRQDAYAVPPGLLTEMTHVSVYSQLMALATQAAKMAVTPYAEIINGDE